MGWFSKKAKDDKPKAAEKSWQEEQAEEIESKKLAYFKVLEERVGFSKEIIEKMDSEQAWLGMSEENLVYMYNDPDSEQLKETKDVKILTLTYLKTNPTTRRKVSNKFVLENNKLVSMDIKSPMKKIWEYRGFSFE